MSDRMTPGERLSRRLASRNSVGLHRRATPDGGEVYTGEAAREALKAVGARAATVDGAIIVDEDFDLSKAEDQALYAHEVHHQMNSGGHERNTGHDAEEMAARAVERMVLHRAATGDDFGSIMRDVRTGTPQKNSGQKTTHPEDDEPDLGEALMAYQELLKSGQSYDQIVRDMTRFVMDAMAKQRESSSMRRSKYENY